MAASAQERKGQTQTQAQLEVERSEIADALGTLARFLHHESWEVAILTFDGRGLTLDVDGLQVRVPADGRWPGQARVPAGVLTGLG